jgi:hypothetical protein
MYHIIHIGDPKEDLSYFNKLKHVNMINGELEINPNQRKIRDLIFKKMFPWQEANEFQKKHFPETPIPKAKYNYEDYKFLIVFIKSYGSNECNILTSELHPMFEINVNIFFRNVIHDPKLINIPKIFLFDTDYKPSSLLSGEVEKLDSKNFSIDDIKNIFIGFVKNNSGENFFKTFVKHFSENKKKSFLKIFEETRLELKETTIESISNIEDFIP